MKEPLLGEKMNCCSKHWKTFLVLFLIIVVVAVTIVLVIVLRKDDKKDDKEEEKKIPLPFEILKNDVDFIKPPIKLSAEFKLVSTENGMTGLLINDPYATYSQINLNIPNGSYTETVPGLAHFGEHMVSAGCEKFPNLVPVYNPVIGGLKGGVDNAYTGGIRQVYFLTVPFNFLFEEAINLMVDWFRYPFYDAQVVQKEIQAVNSEFYLRMNTLSSMLQAILQQLSSENTSLNGMSCGNNETLKPNESEILSKKLRGYHMEVKKPENIFFTLYSNSTMETLENYIKKYLTYKMHEYKADEYDVEDRKKLIENAKNITIFDIFDEKLYNHGIYFNSETKLNMLFVVFQFGNIDYKELQFEVIEYLTYLFNSKSLSNILIEKNYITQGISLENYAEIENNNVILLNIGLTEKGINELSEVLLIIYKYIEIIKKQGYERKYFENFIKYKRNKQLLDFNKNNFKDIDSNFLTKIIRNYRLYGVNQIFTDGTPSNEDYNEEKLKELLNKFQYEKSFFVFNVINKTEDYLSDTFLESPTIKTLKYFNRDYLYGKIPETLKDKIKDNAYNISNLYIREINELLSEKYEKVIPCYKHTPNNCNDLNEFDYEHNETYTGSRLNEDSNIRTIYQIDKSSESFLVLIYLQFHLPNQEYNEPLYYYLLYSKLIEINEPGMIKISLIKDSILTIQIKCFNDNIEKIYEKLIEILKILPNDIEINYLKNKLLSHIFQAEQISLADYTTNLYDEFIKGKKTISNYDQNVEYIEEMLEDFESLYEDNFLKSIESIDITMAGNIDINLVEKIYNKTKDNFSIKENNKLLFSQSNLKNEENSFIINYYEKSNKLDVPDNSILVKYKFEMKYLGLMVVLSSCMNAYAVPLLRFNYSDAYTPQIYVKDNFLNIYERGRYKEIDGMEDDINKVIYYMINGSLECPNYEDIVKSYIIKGDNKVDKTPEYLFEAFIEKLYPNNFKNLKKEEYLPVPNTFEELIAEVSPIFKNPQRFTFLVVRPEISDEGFKNLINKRKENYKYELNESINVVHTDNITYWVNNQ